MTTPGTAAAASLQPVRGLVMPCRVAWWWTRAFRARLGERKPGQSGETKRQRRRIWNYLEPWTWPGSWLANLWQVLAWGPSVVQLGNAAVHVTIPDRPDRQRRPAMLVLILSLVVLGTLSGALVWTVDVLPLTGGWILTGLASFAALLLLIGLAPALAASSSPRPLRDRREALAKATGRPVAVADTLCAWPTGKGGGTLLMAAVLDELSRDRIGLIAHAADKRLVEHYVGDLGGEVRDAVNFPHIVTWKLPPPGCPLTPPWQEAVDRVLSRD